MARRTIADRLRHLVSDEIVGHRGTTDAWGDWTPDGTVVRMKARFEGTVRLTRNLQGQEVVTSLKAIVMGAPGFTPHEWRFDVPDRYTPHLGLAAISVNPHSDQFGPVTEDVYFP